MRLRIRVRVDGEDRGELPVALRDLSAGEHRIRFEGGSHYLAVERRLKVQPGQMLDLGDVKLDLLHAKLTIAAREP